MNKLIYSPDQASYSVGDQQNRITVNYGLAGIYRRNLLNANRPVTVAWSANKAIYTYLKQVYRWFVASGGTSFLCDLMIDNTVLEEFEVTFVAGSFALTGIKGEQYSVKALFNVQPKYFDVATGDWFTDGGLRQKIMQVSGGQYELTGYNIDLRLTVTHIQPRTGLYILSGKDANIYIVQYQKGIYTLTGYDIDFVRIKKLLAQKGSYTLTGYAAGVTVTP